MRCRVFGLSAACCLIARLALPGPITVRVRGDRVDVLADKTPLVQVLNNVAWEAKMKIVYDTAPPQDLVSVDIRDKILADAITDLLAGHGLTYVAKMDPSGARIDTLVLTNGRAGRVNMNVPDAPPPEPNVADAQPEYPPEPPPDMPMATPAPTPAPAAAWTPAPVVMPSVMGATPSPQPYYGASGAQPYAGMMRGGGMAHSAHGPPPDYAPPPEEPPPPPPEN